MWSSSLDPRFPFKGVYKWECVVEASDQITLGHKINILCVATALKVYQSWEKQHANFGKEADRDLGGAGLLAAYNSYLGQQE